VKQTDHKAQVKVCGIILVMNTTEKSMRSTRRKQRSAGLAGTALSSGHLRQAKKEADKATGNDDKKNLGIAYHLYTIITIDIYRHLQTISIIS
jgi:hypothetical protein